MPREVAIPMSMFNALAPHRGFALPGAEQAGDEYAPIPDSWKVCLSLSGRWRPAHDYDRDEVCLYCRRREALP